MLSTAIYCLGAVMLLVAAVLPTRPKHSKYTAMLIVMRIAAGISAAICAIESGSWIVAAVAVVVAAIARIACNKLSLVRGN